MPLQATSGAASYDAFGGGVPVVPQYIEDVFSTYLYTGTGATNNIVNGIDLAGKGGLVWTKARSTTSAFTFAHALIDTLRGVGVQICSDRTDANYTQANSLTAFNTNGYTLGTDSGGQGRVNNTSYGTQTYVSWTFRKQPKFFDVVTYTGNGATQAIAHNLGSVPGMVITKAISGSSNWAVWHRGDGTTNKTGLSLNLTGAAAVSSNLNFAFTSTTFDPAYAYGNSPTVANNNNGVSYVAYLFAHDAGGFGLTGTDNVISCGSFTPDSGGNVDVNLGYEPQWILFKRSAAVGSWSIADTMRGMSYSDFNRLYANLSIAEDAQPAAYCVPTATGFKSVTTGIFQANEPHIYIAIRRGPMKVPTVGTSVYNAVLKSAANTSAQEFNAGFPPDMVLNGDRNTSASYQMYLYDRLRGVGSTASSSVQIPYLQTPSTAAEATNPYFYLGQNGFGVNTGPWNDNMVLWHFRRAPSFFDEVCYTGTGSATTFSHNLTVAPEMMIVRNRSTGNIWATYAAPIGQRVLQLQSNAASFSSTYWNSTNPTSTVFSVGTSTPVNASGVTFVAYLFATCADVSKVGSYTGTGALQTVNCGFTSGARFVLIKRTDSTGDWWTYDSARGISSGNDPYLFLNSTAAEVTGTNYVDTDSTGFKVTATAPAGLNASGGTYIFLAIA